MVSYRTCDVKQGDLFGAGEPLRSQSPHSSEEAP
ncbi:MAG: hypothetical protein QOJ16_2782, partial [Acidobacteriota bacterium]|nr:hypothetical protein [Acidobacteriota bacterium]